jgi:hypothetical protein
VVHGSISPNPSKIIEGLMDCQNLCEITLQCALTVFEKSGLFERSVSDKQFEKAMVGIVEGGSRAQLAYPPSSA